MIISITGKSGSGKSLIAKHIAKKLNFTYVDVDKIGHSIYQDEDVCNNLIELFGEEIIGENGKIDRKVISKMIFSNPHSKLRAEFNELTWKPMKEKIDEIIATKQNVVLDWINLPLVEYWDKSALKVLVISDQKTRFEILRKRDKLTDEQLTLRENGAPNYRKCKPTYTFYHKYNFDEALSFIHFIAKRAKQKMETEKTL